MSEDKQGHFRGADFLRLDINHRFIEGSGDGWFTVEAAAVGHRGAGEVQVLAIFDIIQLAGQDFLEL